jgi:two-component sensor histidine kinase
MDGIDLATRGYTVSVNRAIALFTVAAVVVSVGFGLEASADIDPWWFGIVTGLIVLTTIGLLAVSGSGMWSSRLQVLFAAVVFAALVSWPVAWTGPEAQQPPFMWVLMGLSLVMLGWSARAVWVALATGPLVTAIWGFIRLDESGGNTPVFLAAQESILVLALVVSLVLAIDMGYRAAEHLDASTDRAAALVEQIAIQVSVRREQRELDAVVHDRVMTTLASAGRETMNAAELAGMARRAVASLNELSGDSVDLSERLSSELTAGMVADMVHSVAPKTHMDIEPEPGASVPRRVANALARASREAVLNAVKHAHAQMISVTGMIRREGSRVAAFVSVTDDGIGYVVSAVPERRLGVRLALQDRMRTVGGEADVISVLGVGTTVNLTWRGADNDTGESVPTSRVNPGRYVDKLEIGFLIGILRLQLVIALTLGFLGAFMNGDFVGVAALVGFSIAAVVAVGPTVRSPLETGQFLLILGLLVVASAVSVGLTPQGSTIDVLVVVLLLVLIRLRGTRVKAWSALGVLAVAGIVGAVSGESPLIDAMVPFVWALLALLVTDYIVTWVIVVSSRVDQAHQEFEAAASRAAAIFSTLLRRDVWTAGVRSHVAPLLARLTDQSRPLTDAERAECVRLEAGLRDSIVARNLVNSTVARAVDHARERGVSVTLVDNRGSALPEATRDSARTHLVAAANRARSGRIVARVAPAGYSEAVTIMTDTDVGARWISIDAEGVVTET